MKNFLLIIAFLIIVVDYTYAHDAKDHKGSMIEGTLILLEKDKASIKTEKGNLSITFMPETKFEVGIEGVKGERSQLKEGQYLMVMGHKLKSGDFAATEVMMHEEKEASTDHIKHLESK